MCKLREKVCKVCGKTEFAKVVYCPNFTSCDETAVVSTEKPVTCKKCVGKWAAEMDPDHNTIKRSVRLYDLQGAASEHEAVAEAKEAEAKEAEAGPSRSKQVHFEDDGDFYQLIESPKEELVAPFGEEEAMRLLFEDADISDD